MFFYLFQYLSLHYTINPHKIGTLASFFEPAGLSFITSSYLPTKKRGPCLFFDDYSSMAESASELAPSVAVAEIPSDTGRTVLIAPNSKVR